MNVDIDKIVDDVINYDNKNNKNWASVADEIIGKYIPVEQTKEANITLIKVISNLTALGYDIVDMPFRLKKYK